jgi:hypothetical protein
VIVLVIVIVIVLVLVLVRVRVRDQRHRRLSVARLERPSSRIGQHGNIGATAGLDAAHPASDATG